jgi:cobaltochelatase CobN
LKEAQIRDGLHILGQVPPTEQLRDLAISIARSPHDQKLGLTQAIALDLGLDFDPILEPLDQPFVLPENIEARLIQEQKAGIAEQLQRCRIGGEVVEVLEEIAKTWVGKLLTRSDPGAD